MPIFETFTKREKKRRGDVPDVYQYATLPPELRVQIVYVLRDAIGRGDQSDPYSVPASVTWWRWVEQTLKRERGVFQLASGDSAAARCARYLTDAPTDEALDLVDACFQLVNVEVREKEYLWGEDVRIHPDAAIAELNYRFKEHGVGYEFVAGKLRRIDSQYIHAEAVKPALELLHDRGFAGPEEEFQKAHEHYRHARYKEAIADALKAFESTMKAICDARRWSYPGNATASALIKIIFAHGLIPPYLESEFQSLRTVLESGAPTVRNKTSGHGQGATPVEVPEHLVAYALHLAASNIVFLVRAHDALK